ncbi:SLOG family protein [Nocardia farcinica]|uniref:SLOG family protein n=1 Tax=Nocardia farcinica TaxID=37329 RepID=UPI002453C7CB|nr:SLOG family protein [Nocardia farcinica]
MTGIPIRRRVIVTGSRDWPDPAQVWDELDAVADLLYPGDTLTVVHGDCGRGADEAAAQWVHARQDMPGPTVLAEPHPADWAGPCTVECKRPRRQRRDGTWYCPDAGPRRNAEMVRSGAELLLAFPLTPNRADSPGTWGCLGLAAAARIPFRRIYPRR